MNKSGFLNFQNYYYYIGLLPKYIQTPSLDFDGEGEVVAHVRKHFPFLVYSDKKNNKRKRKIIIYSFA